MKRIVAFALAVMLMILPFTTSLAASKSVKFTVTVTCTLKSNNHVGEDWEIIHEFDGDEYFKKTNTAAKKGKDTISLSQGDILTITTTVIEDEKYPDVATEEITHKITANDIKKGFSESFKVTVVEDRGKYEGNKAVWEIVYEFKP